MQHPLWRVGNRHSVAWTAGIGLVLGVLVLSTLHVPLQARSQRAPAQAVPAAQHGSTQTVEQEAAHPSVDTIEADDLHDEGPHNDPGLRPLSREAVRALSLIEEPESC
jgi:hypothetical protein